MRISVAAFGFIVFQLLSHITFATAKAIQVRTDLQDPPAHCSLKHPPPANAICGAHGHVKPSQDIDVVVGIAQDINECQRWCYDYNLANGKEYNYTFCSTISYHPISKTCRNYAFRASLRNLHFVEDAKSHTLIYQENCFTCLTPCSQELGVNILYNSGFENDKKLIGPWQAGEKHPHLVMGRNSSKALLSEFVQYNIVLCPTRLHAFSFDVQFINPSDSDDQFYLLLQNQIIVEHYVQPNESTNWRSYAALYKPNNSTYPSPGLQFGFFHFDGPKYKLDNVKLYTVDETKPIRITGDNLVMNGGFENMGNTTRQSLKPWSAPKYEYEDDYSDNLYILTKPGLTEGKYKYEFKGYLNGDYDYYTGDYQAETQFILEQKVHISKGKWYRLSMDYKSYYQLNVDAFLEISLGDYIFYAEGDSGDEIHHYSTTFLAVSNVALLTINGKGIFDESNSGNPTHYKYDLTFLLDNIQLFEIAT